MANERGSYGEANGGEGRRSGALPVLLMLGIAAGLYALSPGARHFYKHGRLPVVAAEESSQWERSR